MWHYFFSYILSDDVETVYNQNNGAIGIPDRITTLCYHTVKDSCSDIYVCRQKDRYNSDLEAIKNSGYFTLTLQEMYWYMYELVNLPKKSVLITFDDGYELPNVIEGLKKYDLHGNSFLVTSWVNDLDQYRDSHISFGSHTHNMHNQYECPGYGYQGGGILCLPEETILNDLKTSSDILGGSKYLAYPFFDFNERAIKLLKQTGYHMAFIGEYDSKGLSYPQVTDKYKIRRMTIFNDTSMNEFISYLN